MLSLQTQGEQLKKVDKNLDIMEDNLKKGDYIATGMGSWGFFKNLFKKSPLSKKQTENSNNNKQMPSMEEAKMQNS